MNQCPVCEEDTHRHCRNVNCDWVYCSECQLIIGVSVIPTWERYVAEGKDSAE